MEPRCRLVIPVITITLLVVAGCGEDEERPGPSTTPAPSGTSEIDNEIARSSKPIDIGGRSLHLECWGEPVADEPTVLLLSGYNLSTSSWETMASRFAGQEHHLCSYDRAGFGGSDPAPELRRTTQDLVTDLVALLDAAEFQEPVVLAAHSLGALVAVGLVERAPERVAGVVLVDPLVPRLSAAQLAALPPETAGESPELADERVFLTEFLTDPGQNGEHLLLGECEAEVARLLDEAGPHFENLPVVVLRAPPPPPFPGLPRRYHEATLAAVDAGMKELAAESTRGTLVDVADTDHHIQDQRPGVVMEAIRDVMTG